LILCGKLAVIPAPIVFRQRSMGKMSAQNIYLPALGSAIWK
jgi:hypothetical protein